MAEDDNKPVPSPLIVLEANIAEQYAEAYERIQRLVSEEGFASSSDLVLATVTSARADLRLDVQAFQGDLDQLDNDNLRLLKGQAMQPTQLGIETTLEPPMIEILVTSKLDDRRTKGERGHELDKVDREGHSNQTVALIGLAGVILGALIYAAFTS